MKKSKRVVRGRPAARGRVFRAAVCACVVLAAGVATAIAKYGTPAAEKPRAAASASPAAAPAAQTASGLVTVEVGGRKVQVNAQTLQQGPLTGEQAQRLAEVLEGNQSDEGLREVRHADGTVTVDLEGHYQNVTLAKRNEDGTVSAACVDNPGAARAFLSGPGGSQTTVEAGTSRKAALSR